MIKSTKTSIICERYNFEEEEQSSQEKEKMLTKKLATLIKLTGEIADDLKKSNLGKNNKNLKNLKKKEKVKKMPS